MAATMWQFRTFHNSKIQLFQPISNVEGTCIRHSHCDSTGFILLKRRLRYVQSIVPYVQHRSECLANTVSDDTLTHSFPSIKAEIRL